MVINQMNNPILFVANFQLTEEAGDMVVMVEMGVSILSSVL